MFSHECTVIFSEFEYASEFGVFDQIRVHRIENSINLHVVEFNLKRVAEICLFGCFDPRSPGIIEICRSRTFSYCWISDGDGILVVISELKKVLFYPKNISNLAK